MTRTEWLESRRAGIGSSDVAKVLGLSKWGTALDVYLSKVNPVAAERMTPQQEWGLRKESIVAAAITDHYGWELGKPKTTAHPAYPFLLASPDRLTDADEVVEIKTAERADGWGEPETDEVPEHYWVQVQHQLEVVHAAGVGCKDVAWVFVLIGASDFRRYRVARDPGYLETVIGPLREFWALVEARTPPEPDWSHPTTLDAVQKLFRPRPGSAVELGADALALADEYQRLGAEIGSLGKARDEAKARLIHAMGAAEVGTLADGRTVKRKDVSRAGYTVQPTTYTDFRIGKGKETA